MFFRSSNGKEYSIRPNLSDRYHQFSTISIFDDARGMGIDFKYDFKQGTIDWYHFVSGDQDAIKMIDQFVPNDLRERCQKIVRNIILL